MGMQAREARHHTLGFSAARRHLVGGTMGWTPSLRRRWWMLLPASPSPLSPRLPFRHRRLHLVHEDVTRHDATEVCHFARCCSDTRALPPALHEVLSPTQARDRFLHSIDAVAAGAMESRQGDTWRVESTVRQSLDNKECSSQCQKGMLLVNHRPLSKLRYAVGSSLASVCFNTVLQCRTVGTPPQRGIGAAGGRLAPGRRSRGPAEEGTTR
mmetsp:Transcript_3719/g.9418  ORF Transcript_3719/g.9418 Transcript_3719/m.9418 type:complete len:212 (+) Transcript_3719:454-1089(+)